MLLRPTRLEIHGSLDRPFGAPLRSEVLDDLRLSEDDLRLAEEDTEADSSELAVLFTVLMHIDVGNKDLVAELDGPVRNDFVTPLPTITPATVSRDFIHGIIKFGPSCPATVVNKAIDLVLTH